MWERTCIFSLVEGDVVAWFGHTRQLLTYFFLYQVSIAQRCTGVGFFTSWEVWFPGFRKSQCGSVLSFSNNLVWMQIRSRGSHFYKEVSFFFFRVCAGLFFLSLLAFCFKAFPFSEAWASLPVAWGLLRMGHLGGGGDNSWKSADEMCHSVCAWCQEDWVSLGRSLTVQQLHLD